MNLFFLILKINWDLVIVVVLLLLLPIITSGSPSKWFPNKTNWWVREYEERIKSKNKDKDKK